MFGSVAHLNLTHRVIPLPDCADATLLSRSLCPMQPGTTTQEFLLTVATQLKSKIREPGRGPVCREGGKHQNPLDLCATPIESLLQVLEIIPGELDEQRIDAGALIVIDQAKLDALVEQSLKFNARRPLSWPDTGGSRGLKILLWVGCPRGRLIRLPFSTTLLTPTAAAATSAPALTRPRRAPLPPGRSSRLGQTAHFSVLLIDTLEVKIRTILLVHLSEIGQPLEEFSHTTRAVALPSPLLILMSRRTGGHSAGAGSPGVNNGIMQACLRRIRPRVPTLLSRTGRRFRLTTLLMGSLVGHLASETTLAP